MFTSRKSFEESISVNAAPEVCSAVLFKAANYPLLHPLIRRVENVSHGKDAHGQPITTFYALDRLRIGPISFTVKYKTIMTLVKLPNGGECINFDAYALPNLHLSSVISFQPENSGTQVSEHVSISVLSLLANYSVKQAQAAHKVLLANMKKFAEKGL
jgi:hypothetical protein